MEPQEFKAWRKGHGLTQEQAGALLGLHRTTIVRLERTKSHHMGKLLDLACERLDQIAAERPA